MRKTFFALFIIFLLASSWVSWKRHEITSCFNMPSYVLDNAGITTGIVLMQHHEDEWRIAEYQNGTLILHILKLKGNIIPSVEHRKKSVKTYADYSPLSFGAKSVGYLDHVKAGLITKFNDTVRVFEGNSLEELMQNSTPCQEFITLCPKCRAVLGESWELMRLGYTNVTGGYLIFPTEGKCASSFALKILPYNGTHDFIEMEYPNGIVKGYVPRLNSPPIGNMSLPSNVSKYLESAWGILVMNEKIVLNPDPLNILDELRGCKIVPKITIQSNGSAKRENYGKPCWRR